MDEGNPTMDDARKEQCKTFDWGVLEEKWEVNVHVLKAELGVIETPESDVAETAEWSEERDTILSR